MVEHSMMIADLCRQTGKLVENGRLFGARTAIEKANANLSGAVGELHGQVWYMQGVTYLRLGDWHLTIGACQRFLKHVEAYPAYACLLQGDAVHALDILESVMTGMDWTNEEGLSGLAMCHYVLGVVALSGGEVESAMKLADAANTLAVRCENATVMNRACRLRASVLNRKAGDPCTFG